MKCPICKKTIPDDSLKCPYCKTRTGLVCPNCNTVNSIFDLKCKKCGEEILKICPECKCVNFPTATKCRKCNHEFGDSHRRANYNPLEYQAQLYSQSNAISLLTKGILSKDKKIFSISGAKGIGKSVVIKKVLENLRAHQFLYCIGKCTPITQLTSGGLVQDILLNVFNLPIFCVNNTKFKKDASRFFQNEFPTLSNTEVLDLINFIYPSNCDNFENLILNKTKTFNLLTKVFSIINVQQDILFVIDNFDFIDGFSYEFISNFIKQEPVWKKLKLILVYNEARPAKGYFSFPDRKEDVYTDLGIAPFEKKGMQMFVEHFEEHIKDYPYIEPEERERIFKISGGNPSYLEQILSLKLDCHINDYTFDLPISYAETISKRVALLEVSNPNAYKILTGSAVLGDKINLQLIKQIFGFNDSEFNGAVTYLEKMNFIEPYNEIFAEFKNITLWENILSSAKVSEKFIEINKQLYEALSPLTLNSNAIFGIIAQNLKHNELALKIWTKNTRLSAGIGDTNLYAISQKQCLALINEMDESETLKTRYNISERLGKLLPDTNPKEAMEYLPDAIANAQAVGDTPREIELLGYMSSCCRRTGNYFGDVECIDTVLEKVKPEKTLEIALLKAAKLSSLLNIGNCGQIINMVDNEIMPVLDEVLTKNYTNKLIPENIVQETWIKTYLLLANALIMQGNDRSFEILTILFDIIQRNNIQDELFICKTKLTLAFANTIKGDTTTSEEILEEILKLYRNNVMDNETIIRWNFVNIINNFIRKRYDGLQEDLFQIVTFANNNGDNFTKNILKTLLGKIFKDNEQSKHAMEIYSDQITYFAKEKMALGALLTWYLIADAALITEGPHNAIDIATQALEVAKNPKIDNYFFNILLRMVIVKACITVSDYEQAEMHLESAIALAKKFNLKDLLSRLYLLYGKYYQELGFVKSAQQPDQLRNAMLMFEKVSTLVKTTRNNYVHIKNEKSKNVLKSFCQLNGIKI